MRVLRRFKPSLEVSYDTYDPTYLTLHMVASLLGHHVMLQNLCMSCEIDMKDRYGRTALWWAITFGKQTTVKLLVEMGASQTERRNGVTAPMLALHLRRKSLLPVLLDKAPPIRQIDFQGRIAATYDVGNSNETTFITLLWPRAKFDVSDTRGRTP